MAGNNPEQLSSTDRVVRAITILNVIPGLGFLIPAGVKPRQLWPLIGIVPLSLSACLGLLVLCIRPTRPTPRLIVGAYDLVLVGFSLGIYIWAWTENRRSGMIGGHAALELLAVFILHSYFVFRAISHATTFKDLLVRFRSGSGCNRCPHCINEARARKPSVQAVGAKESYHRVPGRVDEYDENADGSSEYCDTRPSTDDENARLV